MTHHQICLSPFFFLVPLLALLPSCGDSSTVTIGGGNVEESEPAQNEISDGSQLASEDSSIDAGVPRSIAPVVSDSSDALPPTIEVSQDAGTEAGPPSTTTFEPDASLPLDPPPNAPSVSALDTRPVNTSCLAPAPLAATYALVPMWPNLSTAELWPDRESALVAAAQPPGDSTRFILVDLMGVAISVPVGATTPSDVAPFLDLSNVVNTEVTNGGWLSFAFHPDYATNGYAFVTYTATDATLGLVKRLSRFESTDGGRTLDMATEKILLNHAQQNFDHNGGHIAFGPDSYLYFSTGDDAPGDFERARHVTLTDNLFGKILRLDVNVDAGVPYAIPADNPFVLSGGLPEIYAYGFRNPWQFSFDRETGELWLGDVGQDTWEEINLVQAGGFYGWPYHEGSDCFFGSAADCEIPHVAPLYAYTGGVNSISGGYVYRGAAIPSLVGKYLYGDFVSGQVSAYDRISGSSQNIPGGQNEGDVVSWTEDNAGELYVLHLYSGQVQKLVAAQEGGVGDFPALLTQTGCFEENDPTSVVSGVIPYHVAQPFWADGAEKERYFAIPDGTTIELDAEGDWVFPPGAVTIKNFRHNGLLFETRFLVRHSNGDYSGYTYEWNSEQTQANLVPSEGKHRSLVGLEWDYPSRSQCFTCHTSSDQFNLGPQTRQLNIDKFYPATGRTGNQLLSLDSVGVLSGNVSTMEPFPSLADAEAPLQQRAEAYLHVNCSSCHQPGGSGGGTMDARVSTPFANKGLCNAPATFGTLGEVAPILVRPGDAINSELWARMSSRTASSMPPLGSEVVDSVGANLLAAWIDSMGECP